MPVMRCQKNNKPGFKWGKSGACYTYTKGNKRSMGLAKKKALKQAGAIYYRRGK